MNFNQKEKDYRAKRFAEIYLYEHPGNYTKAYEQLQQEIEAESDKPPMKMKSIRSMASRFAQTKEVQEALAKEREWASQYYAIDKDEIVANLSNIAYDEEVCNRDRLAAIKQLTDIAGLVQQNVNLNAKADIEVVIE